MSKPRKLPKGWKRVNLANRHCRGCTRGWPITTSTVALTLIAKAGATYLECANRLLTETHVAKPAVLKVAESPIILQLPSVAQVAIVSKAQLLPEQQALELLDAAFTMENFDDQCTVRSHVELANWIHSRGHEMLDELHIIHPTTRVVIREPR